MKKSNKKNTNNSSLKLYITAFTALISLGVIVSIGFQVDIGFRVEKKATPQMPPGHQVVQDYSFRLSAKGNASLYLEKESN